MTAFDRLSKTTVNGRGYSSGMDPGNCFKSIGRRADNMANKVLEMMENNLMIRPFLAEFPLENLLVKTHDKRLASSDRRCPQVARRTQHCRNSIANAYSSIFNGDFN